MNNFLIPANSKRSMLILGLFTKFDLVLFASGLGVSILLLLLLELNNVINASIALGPALVTGFLVMPVPNYHNIRTVIMSAFTFLIYPRKFMWKGWCFPHEETETKEK